MIKPDPICYRTANWRTYNDALKRRGSLLIWLNKDDLARPGGVHQFGELGPAGADLIRHAMPCLGGMAAVTSTFFGLARSRI